MKLTTIATLLALTGTIAASAFPAAELDHTLDQRDTGAAQACSTKGGCECIKGTSQGQYCGWCQAVFRLGKGGALGDVSILDFQVGAAMLCWGRC